MPLSPVFSATRILAFSLALGVSACAPVLYEPTPSEAQAASDSSRAVGEAMEASSESLRGGIQIVEVYGKRTLRVGENENFRVRLAPGFSWPVQYTWDFDDNIVSVGNNVTHRFVRPGRYVVTVIARNHVNSDTATVTLTVEPGPAALDVPARPAEPVAAEDPFRPGDIVWVAGIYPESETADEWASVFATAGLRTAVLPTYQGQNAAFLVAVGGYRTEEEAIRARQAVLRAQDTPLWLLQLDELRGPR